MVQNCMFVSGGCHAAATKDSPFAYATYYTTFASPGAAQGPIHDVLHAGAVVANLQRAALYATIALVAIWATAAYRGFSVNL